MLKDWERFHDFFANTFEFPGYYGRNMDAWNDCMSDYCYRNGPVSLHIDNGNFQASCRLSVVFKLLFLVQDMAPFVCLHQQLIFRDLNTQSTPASSLSWHQSIAQDVFPLPLYTLQRAY